ncbi:hypothetical protein ACFQU7_21950 [Pseudoroseomonas wenyumeiae]
MNLTDLPANLVPLLGGGVLLLSFALVLRRRVVAAIDALAMQGVLLALVALCHAWARQAPSLTLVAVLLMAGQGCCCLWPCGMGAAPGPAVGTRGRPGAPAAGRAFRCRGAGSAGRAGAAPGDRGHRLRAAAGPGALPFGAAGRVAGHGGAARRWGRPSAWPVP